MTQSGSRRDRPSFEFPATISLTIWYLHLHLNLHFCSHTTPSASTMTSSMENQVRSLVDLIMSGWQQTACKCRSGQVFSFVP